MKKKLIINQENQSKDIAQMCKAIRQDLENFDSDKKAYKSDIEFLHTIKIHKSLSRGEKTSLGDFV